jgi:hypothetical protein
MSWNDTFLELFDRCLEKYNAGNSDFNSYYSANDLKFLQSIGYKPRELFDFIEDYGDGGTPTRSTALLVAAVRRDYFLTVQSRSASNKEITSDDLPSRSAELGGISYLPRIIEKAKAKLRGELHPNLMFGCGGDRSFLQKFGDIPMADFLRMTWAAGDDQQKLLDSIRSFKHA